jgi:hypothetical protein
MSSSFSPGPLNSTATRANRSRQWPGSLLPSGSVEVPSSSTPSARRPAVFAEDAGGRQLAASGRKGARGQRANLNGNLARAAPSVGQPLAELRTHARYIGTVPGNMPAAFGRISGPVGWGPVLPGVGPASHSSSLVSLSHLQPQPSIAAVPQPGACSTGPQCGLTAHAVRGPVRAP